MGHRFDANRNMEHLEQQIHQLMVSMQQRDEQVAQLQAQINHAEEIHAGALAAAQEAANNAMQALNANVNVNFVSQNKELAKIFSFVPDFNGNNLKIFSFIKSVETILPQVQNFDDDLVIQAIKSKILMDTLETAPSETWEEIKQCLLLHFSDKRDEAALIRDLHKLSNSTSLDEFYGKVERMLMLLINRAKLLEAPEVLPTKIEMYQNMATKVFVGGIKGFIGSAVRSQKPKSLNEALLLYNEEKNCQDDSSHDVQPQVQNKPKIIQHQFPIPRQFSIQQQFPNQQHFFNQQQQFPNQIMNQMVPFNNLNQYKQMNPNIQYFTQYPNQMIPFNNFNQAKFPIANQSLTKPMQQIKPNMQPHQYKKSIQPKPIPMEVDPSLRSRNSNNNNFKIDELQNINTDEIETPEHENIFISEPSEDGTEDQNINFLVVSEENLQT